MPPMINFAEMDLRGAFDFAIMIEEDAQIRYEQLSRLLGSDPGGAGDVFRTMAVNEGKHRSELLMRREAVFREAPPRIELSVMGEGVERPEVDDDELPRSAREALEVTLAAEKRAYAFYEAVIPVVNDPVVRAFFQRLLREEAEHQALLAKKIARLEETATRVEDRAPPDLHVTSTVPAAMYPDRALLQSVLPRFDAATQAVAKSVIVEGMGEGDVAAALGVSRRTVARKLTRFLEIARQYAAVAVAAAALGGCDGGFPMTEAPEQNLQLESQRVPLRAPQQAPQAASPRVDDRHAPGAQHDERADRPGEERTEADRDVAQALEALPVSASNDLEFSPGLQEPPQQQVVPAPAPWTPPPDADANAKPVIEDVWPDKGPSSGGDRIVIRGRNLQAAQVLFGLTPATIIKESESELTVSAPAAGVGEVPIVVTNRDGNYAIAGTVFRYFT